MKARSHGEARNGIKTKEYRIWSGLKNRCTNPNNRAYSDYGGRGIEVCERWINSFQNFVTDMGRCPDGMCIERKDNDGPYSKENCVWSTMSDQNKNRRGVIKISHNGRTLNLNEWSKIVGISRTAMGQRYRSGWSIPDMMNPKRFYRGDRLS